MSNATRMTTPDLPNAVIRYPLYRDDVSGRLLLPLCDVPLYENPTNERLFCAHWDDGSLCDPLYKEIRHADGGRQLPTDQVVKRVAQWAGKGNAAAAFWLGFHFEREGNTTRSFWYFLAAIRADRHYRQFWDVTISNTLSRTNRHLIDIQFLHCVSEISDKKFSNDWLGAIAAAERAETTLASPYQIAHANAILDGKASKGDRALMDLIADYPGQVNDHLALFAAGIISSPSWDPERRRWKVARRRGGRGRHMPEDLAMSTSRHHTRASRDAAGVASRPLDRRAAAASGKPSPSLRAGDGGHP